MVIILIESSLRDSDTLTWPSAPDPSGVSVVCIQRETLHLQPGMSFPPLWGAIALFSHPVLASFFNNAALLWFLLPWLHVSCCVTTHSSRHSLHLISIREFCSLGAWISHKSSLISGSRSCEPCFSGADQTAGCVLAVWALLPLWRSTPLQHRAGLVEVL